METINKNMCFIESSAIHVVISWIIFSVFYWMAAYYKPFHVDEFFSWVYIEQTSFMDIIALKDNGIGHPPLYHLLQKMVQTASPSYHFLHVRIVNYIAGLAFLAMFIRVLEKYKKIPWFYYAMASSAALLNIFVFSRMWGLVCLSGVIVLWFGERYSQDGTVTNMVALLLTCCGGLISDYNFVLLLPYVFIVIISRGKSRSCAQSVILILITLLLLSLCFIGIRKSDFLHSIYYLPGSIMKISFETTNMIFNFWFLEPFLLCLSVLCVFYYFNCKWHPEKSRSPEKMNLLSILILTIFSFVVLETITRYTEIRVRHVAPLVVLMVITVILKARKNFAFSKTNRIAIVSQGVVGALLLLLIFNLFAWRDLRDARFVAILFPFIVLIGYSKFSRAILSVVSLVFLVSGILFVSSNGLGDYFPPPTIENKTPVIYEDVFSYSNQYMRKASGASDEPKFLSMYPFKKYCRRCWMGTEFNEAGKENTINIVGWHDFANSSRYAGSNCILRTQRVMNLTWSDRFQFSYFLPLFPRRFSLFEYECLNNDVGLVQRGEQSRGSF